MEDRLVIILDECIERIGKGETIEQCLADYPDERSQLKPLLDTALSVSAVPRVAPSAEFRADARERLTRRLRQEYIKAGRKTSLGTELTMMWQRLGSAVADSRRIAIPVTIAIVLAVVASVLLPGRFSPVPTTTTLAAPSTLSILSGTVEIQEVDSDIWQPGNDGIQLAAGTRIKTLPDSHGLLTFFEGSTLKLEPDTVIEIQRTSSGQDQPNSITIRQLSGRTWSHVQKWEDAVSCFQIETPSASIAVQGTLFAVGVDESGSTDVMTTEGAVTVTARGEKVQLVANQQTRVKAGAAPASPQIIPAAPYELVITTNSPAIGSVRDPSGSSTGYLPSGLSFNQISGSGSLLSANGTHTITIAHPVSGEYVVAFRKITDEPIQFTILARSQDGVVFQYSGTLGDMGIGDWLMRVDLNTDNNKIISGTVSGEEPLKGNTPERIVEVESVSQKIEPIKLRIQRNDTAADNTSDNRSGSSTTRDDSVDTGEDSNSDVISDSNVRPDTEDDNVPDTSTDNQDSSNSFKR